MVNGLFLKLYLLLKELLRGSKSKMTNLKLPEYWSEYDNNDFIFGEKKCTIGRFQIYIFNYFFITLYDSITCQSWGCDCDTFDLDVRKELKRIKKIINDYLTLGKQLKLPLN
jgi:hypothetical protein